MTHDRRKDDERLQKVLYKLETIEKSQDKVLRALYGEEENGTYGLVCQTKQNTADIKELKEGRKFLIWFAGIITAIAMFKESIMGLFIR
jgi:hypothetical protein